MRFYNRIIVLYRTIIYLFLFHSPKSHPVKFQQMNGRGEWGDWANKQQWTSQIRSNRIRQHIKTTPNRFKSILQKSEITHRPSQPINAPTKPLSTSSPPPWGAHLGRANAPAAALGPGCSEDQARKDETILHDWHRAENVVISSYQKMRIPLAREGKISLVMRNKTIQRTKIDFAEGWQTRGT